MTKLIEQIYEAAVPLSKAWKTYMGFDRPDWGLKDQHRTLMGRETDGSIRREGPEEMEVRLRRLEAFEHSMRDELLVSVRDGLLRAYGRQWLPVPSQTVSEITATLFDPDADERPKVDWSTKTITARGLGYEGVRIIAPAEIEQLAGTSPNRRPGRPSFKKEILEAIDHCVALDRSWHKKKRAQKRRDIINYANKHFSYVEGSNPEGFSQTICDEAEREYINKNS